MRFQNELNAFNIVIMIELIFLKTVEIKNKKYCIATSLNRQNSASVHKTTLSKSKQPQKKQKLDFENRVFAKINICCQNRTEQIVICGNEQSEESVFILFALPFRTAFGKMFV